MYSAAPLYILFLAGTSKKSEMLYIILSERIARGLQIMADKFTNISATTDILQNASEETIAQ